MMNDETHTMFLQVCKGLAARSTCLRIQTASLLVKKDAIISSGINGTIPLSAVSTVRSCKYKWRQSYPKAKYASFEEYLASKDFYLHHHEWSDCNEIHGEMRAITNASKNNINIVGSTLYTTYAPCSNCAKLIVSSGIAAVVYEHIYDRCQQGIEFLKNNSVRIQQHSI